jgi:hypothetical protein
LPCPKENTILSENENIRKINGGRQKKNRVKRPIFLSLLGKKIENKRNDIGIIVEDANPILPHNNFSEPVSFK